MHPSAGTKTADLGCGIGCVGRYLAEQFGAEVDAIDVNPLAIRMAEELAVNARPANRPRFKTGDLCETGWMDRTFDSAVSMDVLLFVADKRAALMEVARILKPGGRFAGMSWELRADSAALRAPAFDDYRNAFEATGFQIEVYEETRNWRRLLTDALGALVASEDAIRQEVEGPAAERLLAWARTRPAELEHCRRIYFSVQRRP